MLKSTDRKIAQEFHQRIVPFISILDFRVFGSRARGEETEESDLDVFIEVETLSPELRQRIFELAWQVGFEMDRVISTIVATREQIQNGAIGANPLIHVVKQEGIQL